MLSPWLGSGPEAAAAKRLGLRFIGIELVPEYLDACAARLRQECWPLELDLVRRASLLSLRAAGV